MRNQVLRSLTPGAPPVRGIVYEAVPTDEHLLDFNLFFGASDEPSKLIDNIHRVNDHMDTFGNTVHPAVRPDARVDLPHPVDLTPCATLGPTALDELEPMLRGAARRSPA